jgi:hypothetical protein
MLKINLLNKVPSKAKNIKSSYSAIAYHAQMQNRSPSVQTKCRKQREEQMLRVKSKMTNKKVQHAAPTTAQQRNC